MWDYDNELIPSTLNVRFNKIALHKYKTRFITTGMLSPYVLETEKYGIRFFKYQGTTLLNQKKDLDYYSNSATKYSFIEKLRNDLLDDFKYLYPIMPA